MFRTNVSANIIAFKIQQNNIKERNSENEMTAYLGYCVDAHRRSLICFILALIGEVAICSCHRQPKINYKGASPPTTPLPSPPKSQHTDTCTYTSVTCKEKNALVSFSVTLKPQKYTTKNTKC